MVPANQTMRSNKYRQFFQHIQETIGRTCLNTTTEFPAKFYRKLKKIKHHSRKKKFIDQIRNLLFLEQFYLYKQYENPNPIYKWYTKPASCKIISSKLWNLAVMIVPLSNLILPGHYPEILGRWHFRTIESSTPWDGPRPKPWKLQLS